MILESDYLAELNIKECLNFIHVLNITFDNYVFLWDIDEEKIYFGKPFSKYYAVHEDAYEAVAQPDILKLVYEADREAESRMPLYWRWEKFHNTSLPSVL